MKTTFPYIRTCHQKIIPIYNKSCTKKCQNIEDPNKTSEVIRREKKPRLTPLRPG